jgi:maltose O-acetyltransferase
MVAPGARVDIGPGFVARRDLTLTVQGRLHIGRGMFCNRGVMLAAMHDVAIGDDVRLGERVSVIDHNHVIEPLDDLAARFDAYEAAPIVIGDRVLIGANSVVLAGSRIGDDTVVGAGSVVRGDIPAGVLAAGAPATVKRPLRAA